MKRSTRLLAAAASVTIAVSACGGDSQAVRAKAQLRIGAAAGGANKYVIWLSGLKEEVMQI